MLPGPTVPGCFLISFHFRWVKLSTRTVLYFDIVSLARFRNFKDAMGNIPKQTIKGDNSGLQPCTENLGRMMTDGCDVTAAGKQDN